MENVINKFENYNKRFVICIKLCISNSKIMNPNLSLFEFKSILIVFLSSKVYYRYNPKLIILNIVLFLYSIFGKKIFIEASGGITIKNLSSYLDSGVDAISVGAITHSVISKDFRLEFNYK